MAQAPNNSIKAQQIEFQALKKATGNSHTAKAMPLNIFAVVLILGGGTVTLLSAYRKLYWGINKIEK